MLSRSSNLLILFLFFLFAKGFIPYDEEFVIIICLFIVFIVLLEFSKDSFNKNVNEIIFTIQKFYNNELNFYDNLHKLNIIELNNLFFFKLKFWCIYIHFFNQICLFFSLRYQFSNIYFNLLVNEKLCNFLLLETFIYYKLLNNYKINLFINKVKILMLNTNSLNKNLLNFENVSLLINK